MDPISAAGAYGAQPSNLGRITNGNHINSLNFTAPAAETSSTHGTFTDALTNALSEANQLQNKADTSIKQMATGEVQDIHQVMVAFEQAKLSMQTLVEVRNKLVEAYQEVSRMSV